MITSFRLWVAIWLAAVLVMACPLTGSAAEAAEAAPSAETTPTAEASKPVAAPTPGGGSYVVDFLDYRFDIQLKVEKIWADYLAKYGSQLKRGRAVFSYHVNPDGKVTLVESSIKPVNKDLAVLAHRSIVEANKVIIPFPASVKARHPSGYFNQIAFTVK